jgi:hypothetical protein
VKWYEVRVRGSQFGVDGDLEGGVGSSDGF